jgi:hypothetical protein
MSDKDFDYQESFDNLGENLTKLNKSYAELKEQIAELNQVLLKLKNPLSRFLGMIHSYIWSVDENKDATESRTIDLLEIIEVLEKLGGEKESAGLDVFESHEVDLSHEIADDSKPTEPKCISCIYNVPPPINDCMKHGESGAKIGEKVRCISFTENQDHLDYYEPTYKKDSEGEKE